MGQRLGRPDVPEKFLTPQGTLSLEPGDVRKFRKLVVKGKLAPFYPGIDDTIFDYEFDECPICFLYHKHMNRSKCCGQRICSECFVQIRTSSGSFLGSVCPFCKAGDFNVEACGPKSEQEKLQQRLDDQRILEYRIKQREEGIALRVRAGVCQDSEIVAELSVGQEVRSVDQNRQVHEQGIEDVEPTNDRNSQPLHNRGEARQEPQADTRDDQYESSRLGFTSLGYCLTNRDMLHCAEYLGVFPEDLGVRVDEFNKLLLEQALVDSMMENKQNTHSVQPENLPEPSPNPENLWILEDTGEAGSWASLSTDPNWELTTPLQVSADTSSGSDGASVGERDRVRTVFGPSRVTEANSMEDEEQSCVIEASSSTSNLSGLTCPSALLGSSRGSNQFESLHSQSVGDKWTLRQWSLPTRLGELETENGRGGERLDSEKQTDLPVDGGATYFNGGEGSECSWTDVPWTNDPSRPRLTRTTSFPPRRVSQDLYENREEGELGNVWRNLIAALTLSGDVNPDIQNFQLGMVFVREDAACLEAAPRDGVTLPAEGHAQPPEPRVDHMMDGFKVERPEICAESGQG